MAMEPTKLLALPVEILQRVFLFASDEDVLLGYGFPPVLAESAWFKDFHGEWKLRSPSEALCALQRRNYATKKAIIGTCRTWRDIGVEMLFRCLFFSHPKSFAAVVDALDASQEAGAAKKDSSTTVGKGWWTQRIHITRGNPKTILMTPSVSKLITHTPNLSIFINEWPTSSSDAGLMLTALRSRCRTTLHTLSLTLPALAIAKTIWAIDSLSYLVSLHILFEPPPPESNEDLEHLGAASGLALSHQSLSQLSVAGYTSSFIEQATSWSLPALRSVSIDTGNSRDALPDMASFLAFHGPNLTMLDLRIKSYIKIPVIFDLCASLRVFAFNADCRIPTQGSASTEAADDDPSEAATLVNQPHSKLLHIGLHGLSYAFHVGITQALAETDPYQLEAFLARRANDRVIRALTRQNFPQLQSVRLVSRTLLDDLSRENGPRAGEGQDRYNQMWDRIGAKGIALEDCTGSTLGVLPPEEEETDSEEEDEDEEEYEEEDSHTSWKSSVSEETPITGLGELRALLEECRVMSETRENVELLTDEDIEKSFELDEGEAEEEEEVSQQLLQLESN